MKNLKLVLILTMTVVLGFFPAFQAAALDNGLAQTPPMGWNSYNSFTNTINEEMVRQIADAMVSSGMRDAGYMYLVVDCNWQADPARDSNGYLMPHPGKFPSGMKALADYIHSKGLKIGLHADRGWVACESPTLSGSEGYEAKDAEIWATWGIDYIKNDNCNATDSKDVAITQYALMRDCLQNTGKDIVYSICCWGNYDVHQWGQQTGNLWRISGDIKDTFDNPPVHTWGKNVMQIYDINIQLGDFAGIGGWNDPDMLEVGCNGADNGGNGMTITEYRSHFSLWAIMAAPLMAGNDIRSMSTEIRNILTAPEIIAVNQDPDGIQGRRVSDDGDHEIIVKELSDNSVAVALLNRNASSSTSMTVNWTTIGLQAGSAQVRDLWQEADMGTFTNSYSTTVAPHGVVMLKIRQDPPAYQSASAYLSDLTPCFSRTGYGSIQKDKSIDGNILTLNGTTYTKGIGTHADSDIRYYLGGNFSNFTASVGVDDETGTNGSVIFQVYGDNQKLFDSGVMTGSSSTRHIDIDISGVTLLNLYAKIAGDSYDYDHADWADAYVVYSSATVGPTPAPTPDQTSVPPQQDPVFSGGPYSLDGTSGVDLPDGLTNDLYDFSIACRVNLNTISDWVRIFDCGGDTNIFMMLTPASGNTGNPYFCITLTGNDGEQGLNGNSVLPTGSWQHIAVTKSGTTGILYINGEEVDRNTNMTIHPADMGDTLNNYIGRSQWEQDPYLNGEVDDFFVYNRAISAAEVEVLANTQGSTPEPTPAGTIGDVDGDGDIDIVDALLIAQYYVELDPDGFIPENADTDCDGDIDIVDALLVAQYYVALIDEFC
jgi:alpha-galactosidase